MFTFPRCSRFPDRGQPATGLWRKTRIPHVSSRRRLAARLQPAACVPLRLPCPAPFRHKKTSPGRGMYAVARKRTPAGPGKPPCARTHASTRAALAGLHAPGRPARRRWPQRRYTSPIPRRFMVSGKQAVLLAPGSSRPGPSHRTVAAVALFRVAPRGQWRDRVGLAPNFSIKLRRAPVFRRYEVVMPSYHVRALLSMRIADDERFFRFALI